MPTHAEVIEGLVAQNRELRECRERLRLLAIIAKHQLPPPKRRGMNQHDLASQIAICEEYGDLDPREADAG